MKRLALVALVLFAAACTKKDEAATDTAAAVPAAATPAMDSGMVHDSTKSDTAAMKADTSKKADTTKH